MRVLVAMSGGVDSSVAAAVLVEEGHEVVGATMKLWGGAGDSGCCSVGDVEDARRVARQLGITHHVFNLTRHFEDHVVSPYISAHQRGETPNPCIECNRHIKFGWFLQRGWQLGFDAVATGHHARLVRHTEGVGLYRGSDRNKDQSYVLAVLDQAQLQRVLLPIGEMTKEEVRSRAVAGGLATAHKPDSQEVCFISRRGRAAFLGARIGLNPGRVVDAATGGDAGEVPALELVTVGQRRGLGVGGDGRRRYALDVDTVLGTVTVGPREALASGRVHLDELSWTRVPVGAGDRVEAQCSAHGRAWPARVEQGAISFERPQRMVAPGQTVALYRGDEVLGAGIASRSRRLGQEGRPATAGQARRGGRGAGGA